MNNGSKKTAGVIEMDVAGPELSEGERSEPEGNGGPAIPAAPDPQVFERPQRRRFTVEYKDAVTFW